jgi:hypothetical protein
VELPNLSEALSIPDVFWASGDAVFQKLLPRTWRRKSPSVQAMHRMTDIRGNLNYHLLTHRRLIITDTSLLLSPQLMTLIEKKPAYSEFLRQGIIVPAMREGVASFQDLVKILRKRKNWVEPSRHDVDKWAKFIDSVRPTVAFTPTTENREVMDSIGSEKLLRSEFWKAVGLGKASDELVKYVPSEMKKNNQKHIRQTEFWKYAARLDQRRAYLQAHKIRTRLSIISLGVMAKNFGLPLSYPAAYSNQLDEVYGTCSPYHRKKDLVITDKPILEEKIDNIQQDFYTKVYYLWPDVIWHIRETSSYKKLLRELERNDRSHLDTDYEDFFLAWKDYLHNFPLAVGLYLTNTQREWSRHQLGIRWLVSGEIIASQSVGCLCSYVLRLPIMWPEMLSVATTAATIFFKKRIEKKKKKLEREAQLEFERAIPTLQREHGELVSELYGPIAREYW